MRGQTIACDKNLRLFLGGAAAAAKLIFRGVALGMTKGIKVFGEFGCFENIRKMCTMNNLVSHTQTQVMLIGCLRVKLYC